MHCFVLGFGALNLLSQLGTLNLLLGSVVTAKTSISPISTDFDTACQMKLGFLNSQIHAISLLSVLIMALPLQQDIVLSSDDLGDVDIDDVPIPKAAAAPLPQKTNMALNRSNTMRECSAFT